jgi:hypothetical protein
MHAQQSRKYSYSGDLQPFTSLLDLAAAAELCTILAPAVEQAGWLAVRVAAEGRVGWWAAPKWLIHPFYSSCYGRQTFRPNATATAAQTVLYTRTLAIITLLLAKAISRFPLSLPTFLKMAPTKEQP